MAHKMCKKCAKIHGMAKKTSRKSTSKSGVLMTGAAVTAGLLAGAVVVPKVVDAATGGKDIDPKIVNGAVAAAAWFGATKTKGHVQHGLIGLGAGAALKLISQVAGISGIGAESNSYGLDYVAGSPATQPNGGAI